MDSNLIFGNALQSIFDDMRAFVFLKDTNNYTIKVNARVAESHGVTPECMAGRHTREFYGAQADVYFEDDKEVIRTGLPKLNIIEPLPLDENNIRWIETNKIPVRDDAGNVVGILVIANDITEKRAAEQDLAENTLLLQTVVESFSEALGFYDAEKRLQFGNRAYWEMHEQAGMAEHVRIGKTFEEIAASIAASDTLRAQNFDLKPVVHTINERWRDHQHSYEMYYGSRWVRYRSYPTPEGGRIVFAYDVTENKEAEIALRKSEARYQTLASVSPVGIFQAALDGRCNYANSRWYDITGIAEGDEVGRSWTDVIHKADRPRVDAEWRDAITLQGAYSTECRIERAQGGELWVLATIAVEPGDGDALAGFVGSFTDISHQKRVELQLRETEQDLRAHRDQLEDLVEQRTSALHDAQQSLLLRERLAAIGQLTATVSHELRNPLGTIVASFAALKHRIDLRDEKVERTAARIERNVKRCETIIDDLLNYTRVRTMNFEVVEFDFWLSHCLAEGLLPAHTTLRTRFGAGCCVQIDKNGMTQVISNLLENAVDAMNQVAAGQGPPGSPDIEPQIIEVRTAIEGDELRISVADTGAGMSAQDFERVFEPLISTKTFGVGLGLPLVRQIVELHGGRVEIRGRDARGVEVVIHLPLDDDRALQAVEDKA